MAITVIYSDMGDVDCASIPLLWKDVPDVHVMRLARDTDYTKDDIREAIRNEDDTLIMCGHGTPRGLLGYVCEEREERIPTAGSWGYTPGSRQRGSLTSRYGSGRMMSMSEMYARLKHDEKLPGAIGPMVDRKPAPKPVDKPAEKPEQKTRIVKYRHMDNAVDASMVNDIHAERVIAVWCHATSFAEAHHLYGFWSSMFISNSGEARMCGYNGVTQETIVAETYKFWRDANTLLKNDVPLDEWIDRLMEMGNLNYPTTRFNYEGLRYYPR
jgi:hypothetical protein